MSERKRCLFFGTPEFAATILKRLLSTSVVSVQAVVTQPDRPAGRGRRACASPVKQLALDSAIPVLQPEKIKSDPGDFINRVAPLGPYDIAIVVAFGQILPLQLLELPRCGSLNVHASLLPRWRGAAPIQRAIMNGDARTGVCLMRMEAGLDTGPVYSRCESAITELDTFGSLHDRLAALGADLLCRDLPRILRGELEAEAQPSEGVTYANRISNQESRIDWSAPASDVSARIRGLSPAPGAFTTLHGKRLRVLFARSVGNRSDSAKAPGTVVISERSLLEVSCGTGAVQIDQLQLEGKKRLETAAFLAGNPLPTDTVLGV